jgi:LuxR family maltose regulon positive regulatory protein
VPSSRDGTRTWWTRLERGEVGDALADHDRVLLPFLVHPVPALLERFAGLRAVHPNLIAEIFSLLVGQPAAAPVPAFEPLQEPLTETEARVLRYLPTDLSKPEIASELYVPVDTIKTHVKHLYAKLDVHSRREAVRRARELGLLPRSSRKLTHASPAEA